MAEFETHTRYPVHIYHGSNKTTYTFATPLTKATWEFNGIKRCIALLESETGVKEYSLIPIDSLQLEDK